MLNISLGALLLTVVFRDDDALNKMFVRELSCKRLLPRIRSAAGVDAYALCWTIGQGEKEVEK